VCSIWQFGFVQLFQNVSNDSVPAVEFFYVLHIAVVALGGLRGRSQAAAALSAPSGDSLQHPLDGQSAGFHY
jgi:hypothetical protein